MKIAVNTRLLVPSKMDGIGRFTFETIQEITKTHKDVSFTLIFDRKVPSEFKFEDNVKCIHLAPQARLPILWKIWFEHRLKRFINKKSFDLFLSPEGWIPPKLNCPSLAVIHDLNYIHHPENIVESHLVFFKKYFPKYISRASRIATVSDFSKKDICKSFNVSPEKVDVVYNGASDSFRIDHEVNHEENKLKYSDGYKYFIFIGTLHPRKNLENLFLAYDVFRKKNKEKIHLLIVGNRKWWPEKLERIYGALEFKDDIKFLGRLNDNELSNVLSSAIALTYIPYFEGFGIPILEAFNTKIPVITSNVSSMPEVAENGAILCSPTKPEEIASAMENISNNEELRKTLIANGAKRSLFFSWEKTSKLLWNSIEKTIQT